MNTLKSYRRRDAMDAQRIRELESQKKNLSR